MWLIRLVLLLFINGVEMVQREDFKTCRQSSFCRRNRALASKAAERGSKFASPYTLVESSMTLENGVLTGTVLKSIARDAQPVVLPLRLTFLSSGVARFTLDEQRRRDLDIQLPASKEKLVNKARYNETEKYTIVGGLEVDEKVRTMTTSNGLTLVKYGPAERYTVELTHSPLKVVFLRDGQPEIIFNDRGLLNLEHWRSKEEVKNSVAPEDGAEMGEKSDEPTDENDPEGMWEEDFNGKRDSKPRGPESVGLDITFAGYADVYGIPEHTGTLSLKETTGSSPGTFDDPYRLYNTDVFQYEYDSPMALYGAIPFMQAHKKGSDVGVFWLNGAETWVDIVKPVANPLSFSKHQSTQTHWVSETGLIDAFVFMGPTAQDLYKTYGELIGFSMLPPLFSIAHHQCRWNYESEDDVLDVTANFDKYDIPYDVIWLDVEYAVGKRYFTWNKAYFPDPARMMDKLEETKRKLVAIIDPHVKKDDDFQLYKEAISNDYCIKNADGGIYEGQCWPGVSIWPDFTNPKVADWWAAWYDSKKFEGSKDNLHIWNDMNEPAIFTGPDISMHRDSIHMNGWEHRDLHNIYGSLMVKSTYDGLKARNSLEPKRPFILSRSFWPGVHRFGAIWSGDNMGTWEHLESATATLINNGIAGMTFSGADVGGFFDDPPKDMLTRWYQAGAFYPFFRAHAHIDTKRREPWLAGEPYTGMIRAAIILRYSLLPTWYTAFHKTSISGMPIMRPHFVVFPDDEAGFKVQNQYFIGDSGLLHHPVVKENAASIELYIADSQPYYDYYDFTVYQGKGMKTIPTPLEYNPLFIHGGHIVTRRDRQRRSSELTRYDPVTLVIALDNAGTANGTLYQDDGETFRNEQGEYVYRAFAFSGTTLSTSNLHPSPATAAPYEASISGVKVEKVLILGYTGKHSTAKVIQEGKAWTADVTVVKDLAGGKKVLSIRDPRVQITKDWTISLA